MVGYKGDVQGHRFVQNAFSYLVKSFCRNTTAIFSQTTESWLKFNPHSKSRRMYSAMQVSLQSEHSGRRSSESFLFLPFENVEIAICDQNLDIVKIDRYLFPSPFEEKGSMFSFLPM